MRQENSAAIEIGSLVFIKKDFIYMKPTAHIKTDMTPERLLTINEGTRCFVTKIRGKAGYNNKTVSCFELLLENGELIRWIEEDYIHPVAQQI
jgi:hypothetical protein